MTYLKYLDSLRASESFRSVWIFAESSFKIFEFAKKRVYQIGRSDGASVVQNKGVKNKKRKLDDSNKDKQGEGVVFYLLSSHIRAYMSFVYNFEKLSCLSLLFSSLYLAKMLIQLKLVMYEGV